MHAQEKQIRSPSAFQKGIILLCVLLVTFVSFVPSLRNDFTNWDDESHYLENADVLALDREHIARIFTGTVLGTYIPLTILSFTAERQFFGNEAYVFHRDNLLLHMGVVVLIFFFALNLGMGVYGAGFAALLFGIHPMHVESVAWVTARKDVLYAFFYMLALNQYLRYLDTSSRKAYWFSIACGVLSVLAKPMALSLPLILFLCDWMKKRSLCRKLFLEKAPYFLLILPIAAVTYFMNARVIHNELPQAFLIWNWSLMFYIQKFFVPFNFYPLYTLPKPVSPLNLSYGLSLFLAAVLVIGMIRLKRDRWFIFACLYYFFSIFFLLRYDEGVDISIVADRFMYLPSLGFCLLLGVVLERTLSGPWLKRPARAVVIMAVAAGMIFCAYKTFVQCKIWKDGITLWTTVIEGNPHNPSAYFGRARAYENKEQYDLAVDDYSRAIPIKNDYAKAYANRGNVYVQKGQNDLALADFNQAIQFNPGLAEVYNNRGKIFYEQGQHDLALVDFNTALEKNPKLIEAYSNKGSMLAILGEYSQAFENFNTALALAPDSCATYVARGITYHLQEKYDLALSDFNTAIRMNPNFAQAYASRGNLYYQRKQWDQALVEYTQALKLSPRLADTYYHRSVIYMSMGKYPEALLDAHKAASLGYPNIQPHLQELIRLGGGVGQEN